MLVEGRYWNQFVQILTFHSTVIDSHVIQQSCNAAAKASMKTLFLVIKASILINLPFVKFQRVILQRRGFSYLVQLYSDGKGLAPFLE